MSDDSCRTAHPTFEDICLRDLAYENVMLEEWIDELEVENQVLRETVAEAIAMLHQQTKRLQRAADVTQRLQEKLRRERSESAA